MEPDQLETSNGSMSVTEVTGLVQLFNNSLLAMEGRLVVKMDDSSRLASERWSKHDRDSEHILTDIDKRFELMEAKAKEQLHEIQNVLKTHVDEAEAHWKKERDEEIRFDARIVPVKGAVAYVRRNWKTILLVTMSLLAVIGFSSETVRRFVETIGL